MTEKEKQIEEMAKCENCIHERVCVIRGFPSAFENTHWEKEPCDHYCKQSEGEWISVEERLPEPNEECLVSARVGDRVVIDLGEIVKCWNGLTNKYGFTWMITNDWDEGEGCEITHWMPLPEPPKGD